MSVIIIANPRDNVATCTKELLAKETFYANETFITVKEKIPLYHKIAITPIKKGAGVYKYGEIIGLATQDIAQGEYAHIHNIESARGRGDKI